jgi:hypothetical protein
MLYDQRLPRHPRQPAVQAASAGLVSLRQRLNWRTWRTMAPEEQELLTSAELSECTCPDICHRDHDTD